MESPKTAPEKIKAPYEKPIIETVSLVPKETVLGGCMTPSNPSPLVQTTGCSDINGSCILG
jgi:hypothetical protein